MVKPPPPSKEKRDTPHEEKTPHKENKGPPIQIFFFPGRGDECLPSPPTPLPTGAHVQIYLITMIIVEGSSVLLLHQCQYFRLIQRLLACGSKVRAKGELGCFTLKLASTQMP